MSDGIWIIDVFTPIAFRGNAAGVYIMNAFEQDEKLQLLAAQMNLSETAFVVPVSDKKYKLRWFTPDTEVPLCGHATIAATHVLQQLGHITINDHVAYDTLSGEVSALITESGIQINFPLQDSKPTKSVKALDALGTDIIACERNDHTFLVEVADLDALIAITPQFKKLAKAKAQGIIVTTATGLEGFDYACRYFAPAIGINEDMATGSIQCMLAPYWKAKLNKTSFHVLQASKGHGIMDVEIQKDRVLITGQAITTLKGQLNNPTPKGTVAC